MTKKSSGILAANFWTDTRQRAGFLTCDKKASVILQEQNRELTLVISDPTWKQEEPLELTLEQTADSVLSADSNILVKQLRPCIKLQVDLKGRQGAASRLVLSLDSYGASL